MLKQSHRSAYHQAILCAILTLSFPYAPLRANLSSLAKNDPYPMFTFDDPHEFLLTQQLLEREAADWSDERGDTFSFSVCGFFQNADVGKPFDGGDDHIFSTDEVPRDLGTANVALLDLTGRTPMIPLVFGPLPQGQQLGPVLQAAQSGLFPTQTPPISDCNVIDPGEKFAFFEFPAKYRKNGVAFDMQLKLFCDFGFHLQTRIASICQAAKRPINHTCDPATPCWPRPFTEDQVNELLMDQLDCIAKEIHLSLDDFQKTSLDEIRLNVYWRHAFDVNPKRDNWPQFFAIPFVEFGGSFSPGHQRDTNEFYGLPFGNNGHSAAGITGGLDLDFVETIAIGGEVGYTHFFGKDFDCYRIPNDKLQNNIFPFRTNVHVQPGHNIHYGGKIAARHFLGNLSMYFQYISLQHFEDTICLQKPDPAFVPCVLADKTDWKAKFANIAFWYDFSPNFTVGFLWQAPLMQRNTYRSTTIMFGVTGYF